MGQMKKIGKSLSLRKSIAVYITVFCFLALVLCLATVSICDHAIGRIKAAYPVIGEKYYLTTEQGERLGEGNIIGYASMPMTKADERIIAFLNLVRVLCVPVYSAVCIIGAALLFYRDRLKIPLELLIKASEKIAGNDLDFFVEYDGKDELGQLCGSFEIMRSALSSNISEMGHQMEERKRLNAAFAHDLRTPLTVLKGYDEMLQASGEEQTRTIAVTMGKHIDRLEHYVESMSRLRRLEDAKPERRMVQLSDFADSLIESAEIICKQQGKEMRLLNHADRQEIFMDAEFVSQVCTNLIANAARYAENLVTITMKVFDCHGMDGHAARHTADNDGWKFTMEEMGKGLVLSVADDGKGFGQDTLQCATDPYYTEEENHFEHFGLGLYICKVLCEHHGGFLTIQNTGKGAQVTAIFKFGVK